MQPNQESSRYGNVIQQALEIAHAQIDGAGPIVHALAVNICDVDIPIFVANGDVYVQTTLQEFHDAVSATLVEFLRNLEVGISEARSAALAFASAHPELGVQGMVVADVVRGGGEQ